MIIYQKAQVKNPEEKKFKDGERRRFNCKITKYREDIYILDLIF
jgi:hypothetical protein